MNNIAHFYVASGVCSVLLSIVIISIGLPFWVGWIGGIVIGVFFGRLSLRYVPNE